MPQRKVISQREARRCKKRVEELERRLRVMRNSWRSDYPGICVATIGVNDINTAKIRTAIRLEHPVALIPSHTDGEFYVYAVR